ncbi:MAG: TatD family hydrolase [Pseudomonadota bacterium]
MTELFDIGANLADSSFDEDRDAVVARARAAGVQDIVITGSSLVSNRRAATIASTDARLYYTTGVHPHHAADYDHAMHQELSMQMSAPDVVAAGECGLDYFRNLAPADRQRDAFERQLSLAAEFALPVFLHQRDAHDDFLEVLKPWLPKLPRAVTHCFTAGQRELEAYLALDLYVGITGWICDERRGQHLLPLVAKIPADRLLIETDAPYLLPRSLRPKPKTRRNEPAWLPEVARVVAAARDVSVDELASQTTANAKRFFGLAR